MLNDRTIKPLAPLQRFFVLGGIILVTIALILLFVLLWLPAAPGTSNEIPQTSTALQEEKDQVMQRINAAAINPLSLSEKQAIFDQLVKDNGRLRFTDAEKQQIYAVINGG